MENQIQPEQNFVKPKSKYFKFLAGFFAMILGVFILYIIGFWVWRAYDQWQGKKEVQKLAEELERLKQEEYERAMADAYGGKTPQETLKMYIDAVEKGDYELASKYFIEEKREGELNRLNNAKQNSNNLKFYISFIKNAKPWRSSLEEQNFTMEAKIDSGPSMFIRLSIYPNGIWKIIEI